MNAENFSNYLKNASQLYQLSYQELKSLVLQYPYCQNLHYLLLKKSRMENHKDLEQNLQTAAAYSIDRDFLYKLMKEESIRKEVEENYLLAEDYLELKDLSAIEEAPEQTPPASTNEGGQEEQALKNFVIEFDELPGTTEDEPPTVQEDSPEREDMDNLNILENLAVQEELELGVSPEEDSDENLEDLAPKATREAKSSPTKIVNLNDLVEKEKEEDSEKSPESLEDRVIASVLSEMGAVQVESPKETAFSGEEALELSVDLVENLDAFAALLESFELPQERSGETVFRRPQDIPFEITNEEEDISEPEDDFTQPEAKEAFSSWAEQFQSSKTRLRFGEPEGISGKVKKKKKRKKKKKNKKSRITKSVAQQSIVENEEIVSEPLAALLESQGHYKKAIAMYERLSLLFPEKSTFFAAKIEQLKEM